MSDGPQFLEPVEDGDDEHRKAIYNARELLQMARGGRLAGTIDSEGRKSTEELTKIEFRVFGKAEFYLKNGDGRR